MRLRSDSAIRESFRMFVISVEEQMSGLYKDETDVPEGYDCTRLKELELGQLEATGDRIKEILCLFEKLEPKIEKDIENCLILL